MNLNLIGNEYRYELEKLIRLFLPFEKINVNSLSFEENSVLAVLEKKTDNTKLAITLNLNGKTFNKTGFVSNDHFDYERECERLLAVMLFQCFYECTGYKPKWGILTGIRPAKLYSKFVSALGEAEADKHFKENFLVDDEKLDLLRSTYIGEREIVEKSSSDSFSLYISIPFCPSRCSYCSFVSHSVDKAGKLIPDYIEHLKTELKITAQIAKNLNLNLETVYIGGGTPTAITAEQIEDVMKTVAFNFDLSNLKEYTVEAGRPDTITEAKLNAIKENGATRISINPQTMNDSVLNAIGRKHTSSQTEEAFLLARKCGFNNINMDLIAGLPTDTAESFENTLERIIKLDPESVTVHSLSVKRASNITKSGDFSQIASGQIAEQMVQSAKTRLSEKGILPYYMYRQSKTVGNLENVGYSKKGYEGIYNVFIMDETHTILACGASAVTKLREPCGDNIERIFNFKYPYEYINQFDEMIERKKGIAEFYNKYKF